MYIFLIVSIIVYFAINLWITRWFWRALSGAVFFRGLVCLLILLLTVSFPVLYWKSGASAVEIALIRAGSIWAGSFFYVFLMLCLVQFIGLVGRILNPIGAASVNALGRRAPRPRPKTAVCVLVLTVLLAAGGWLNAAFPQLTEIRLQVPVKTDGSQLWKPGESLTIGAISDVHLGRIITATRLERAISLLLPHQPDIVCFVGDVLDDHILLDNAAITAALARLEPPLGVWGIAGNHEYYSGEIGESLSILEKSGMRILRDEAAVPGGKLVLAGRDDYGAERLTGTPRASLADILAPRQAELNALPLVILDHQPYHLEEAEAAGAALQLSGHTHNAQLWPWNHLVAAIYENARGLSQRGDTWYYVSVGAGTWGPPLRNNARPEVVLIHLDFITAQ